MRSLRIAAVVVLTLSNVSLAAQKELTLGAIYNPKTKFYFEKAHQSGFRWLDDQKFIWPKTDIRGELVSWYVHDTATGRETPLFEREALIQALESSPELSQKRERVLKAGQNLRFVKQLDAFLLPFEEDLYLYQYKSGELRRLTSRAGAEKVPQVSPDGKSVSFVRNHDLYVLDLDSLKERRLTHNGSSNLLNGILDWLYQEEIYGRGRFDAHWWSPDSKRIAFLQLNERDVPRYTLVDHLPYRPELEVYPYPKAGDPNPIAKLFVVDAAGGSPREIDLNAYPANDLLISSVGWTPDATQLVVQVQDRVQSWLDLLVADPRRGRTRRLFRDTTPAWVDYLGDPHFLKDGTFLWLSERTGWQHLYRYRLDGTLIGPVTSGEWEVRELLGVDEDKRVLYFTATTANPIGKDLYRASMDGGESRQLTTTGGTHQIEFNKGLTLYIDRWSDMTTPPAVELRRADGTLVRTVAQNDIPALAQYRMSKVERVQVPTSDGFLMEGVIIRPPDFDPTRRYPVFWPLYGGPHAPTVRDAWRGTFHLFNQLVAQQGVVVFLCDNRTASGKGAVSVWPLYKQFGRSELADMEDAVRWLKRQPGIDAGRILLSGWSYGGFLVSYALTHSKSFIGGIAGGSVTDWRDYDTIYTERYLLTPQQNPEGYRKSSPRFAAESLHGKLLLIHGTVDDNVHMQNTLQFAYELQQAGKQFQLMLYPKSAHGVGDPKQELHLREMMLDFIRETLLTGKTATAVSSRSMLLDSPTEDAE